MISGVVTSADGAVFGVFDGMGGEQAGEYASYIAASVLEKSRESASGSKEKLCSCCLEMNKAVCSFARENGVRSMGSTACLVNFSDKELHFCNIGDSKIYHLSQGVLLQLSVDHCLEVAQGKAPLTQFIGVPEEEFIIQPHITSAQYRKGDRFLICSDGLTDMVPVGKITEMLDSDKNAQQCCEALLEATLGNGGRDNITVLICDIVRKKLF